MNNHYLISTVNSFYPARTIFVEAGADSTKGSASPLETGRTTTETSKTRNEGVLTKANADFRKGITVVEKKMDSPKLPNGMTDKQKKDC